MLKNLLSRFLFVLMLTLLVAAYYIVHKPVGLEVVFLTLVDVVTVSVFIIFTAGIGRFILRKLNLHPEQNIESAVLSSAMGLSLYSLVVLGLGVIGLFNALALWGVLIAVQLLSWRDTLAWLRSMRAIVAIALSPQTTWTRFLSLFIGLVLGTALLFAFAPETSWDAQAYRLVAVDRYVESGQIITVTDNLYLGQSQGVEMLFAVPYSLLHRNTVTAPIHLWFGFLGLLLCATVVRRVTDKNAGWFAFAIPLTGVSFWWLMGITYVDLAVFAYAAVIVYLGMRWREKQETRWLWLAGYFVGVIVGVKYTAGLTLISLALLVIFTLPRPHIGEYVRRLLIIGIVVGVIAFVVFSPWMVRGYLQYDNPIYPLGSSGLEWNEWRATLLNLPDTGLAARGEAWHAPIIPLTATILGVFSGGSYEYEAGLLIFTLPFTLLLVWGVLPDAARKRARDAFIMLVPIWIAWSLTALNYGVSLQPRLMSMLFPMFIIMGGIGFYGVTKLDKKPLDVSFILRIVVVVAMLLVAFDVLRLTERSRALGYHVGTVSADEYLLTSGAGALYEAFQNLEALADEGVIPADARIRHLWEPRSYYCPQEMTCLPDELLDHWITPLHEGLTPEGVVASWAERDEYLLYYRLGHEYLLTEEIGMTEASKKIHRPDENFKDVIPMYLEELWSNSAYAIYRIK